MTDKDPFDAAAITDWLEALKSRSESPEVIALQRDLLALLQRAAKQLPEVQALVQAAQTVLDDDGMHGLADAAVGALARALKPFEDD